MVQIWILLTPTNRPVRQTRCSRNGPRQSEMNSYPIRISAFPDNVVVSMVSSRMATLLVGLGLSVAISVAAWWYFNTLLVFLFVPFVPFLFRDRTDTPPVKTCPDCGFTTRDPSVNFCPRDGTALEKE